MRADHCEFRQLRFPNPLAADKEVDAGTRFFEEVGDDMKGANEWDTERWGAQGLFSLSMPPMFKEFETPLDNGDTAA